MGFLDNVGNFFKGEQTEPTKEDVTAVQEAEKAGVNPTPQSAESAQDVAMGEINADLPGEETTEYQEAA